MIDHLFGFLGHRSQEHDASASQKPSTLSQIQLAGGSVVGRDHRFSSKNNHDSLQITRTENGIVAVVTDGCGSGAHSEVGAKIGARLLCMALASQLIRTGELMGSPFPFLERSRLDVLAHLRVLANAMGASISEIVNEYLLFTVVGVIATNEHALFFATGDGIVFVNGSPITIGPFPNNEPPYLAYDLVDTQVKRERPHLLHLNLVRLVPTPELDSFLIGTDGVADLIAAESRKVPGKEEQVGSVSQFWTDDIHFNNTDGVRRRLSLINRDVSCPDWGAQKIVRENGLLRDDTTIIVGRRRPGDGRT